tara:strand:+ start:18 stop:1046 length:1029 start_codon:yes stop_codon:yes gene_type:complete
MAKSIQEFSNINITNADKDLQLDIEILPGITNIVVLHIKDYNTNPVQTVLTLNTHYTFSDTTKVVTLKQGSFTISDSADKVSVLRTTDISEPSVSFTDTSLLTDTNLNQAVRQSLFKLQEVSEQNQEGYDTSSLSLSGSISANTAAVARIESNGYVTNERLAGNAVTSDKIQDGTILGADLNATSVKETLGDLLYPLGTVYCNMLNSADPATILGFGTWTRIEGKAVVGYSSSETEFDSLLETGGSKTHTLTPAELAEHNHEFLTHSGGTDNTLWRVDNCFPASYVLAAQSNRKFCRNSFNVRNISAIENVVDPATKAQAGAGQAHNNLQPYIVGSLWYRSS